MRQLLRSSRFGAGTDEHSPDVELSAAIGRKNEVAAVEAPRRLAIGRAAGGDLCPGAARAQRPDVAVNADCETAVARESRLPSANAERLLLRDRKSVV